VRRRDSPCHEVTGNLRPQRGPEDGPANESQGRLSIVIGFGPALGPLEKDLARSVGDCERQQRVGWHPGGPPSSHAVWWNAGIGGVSLAKAGYHRRQHAHDLIHGRVIGRVANSIARPVAIHSEKLGGGIVGRSVRDGFASGGRVHEQVSESRESDPRLHRELGKRIADYPLDLRIRPSTGEADRARWHHDSEPVDRPVRARPHLSVVSGIAARAVTGGS